MLSRAQAEEAISGRQERFVDFLCTHAALWRTWADQADSMLAGAQVGLEDVPDFFRSDYEWAEVVLDMGPQGQFNWNDPRIARLFAKAVQTPFYRLWGETIVDIALALAGAAGSASLIEIGAGRGNLSAGMLEGMHARGMEQPLVITDAHATVLASLAGLRQRFPGRRIDTAVWDVEQPPPSILAALASPVLLYERASLTYANFSSIENLARAADVLVLGDYFNYTGELFAYDLLFEKIGLKPLMYSNVRPLLEGCFSEHIIVDRQVTEAIGLPNVCLIVAWK